MNVDRASEKSGRALVAAIDEAATILRKAPPLSDESVHDARRAIKKARAALRLLREGVGEPLYEAENAALRDAGRSLAPIRDAKSLTEAFNAFRERHPDAVRNLNGLAKGLGAKRASTRRRLFDSPDPLRGCHRSLATCRERVGKWQVAGLDPSLIAGGLERIHRAGRKALAAAQRSATPEALHEWRKQVKYLSNALKVLGLDDADLAKTEKRADKLADCLGEDHDLVELARYFDGEAGAGIDAGTKTKLAKLVGRHRAKLQKRAFGLGAKIYAGKPGRFVARLARVKN